MLNFSVDAGERGQGRWFRVAGPDTDRAYEIPGSEQQHYADFFAALSRDFGTRLPHIFTERVTHPEPTVRWKPLLTENVHPAILAGYGDPAVMKTDKGYYLVATSNDAPHANFHRGRHPDYSPGDRSQHSGVQRGKHGADPADAVC